MKFLWQGPTGHQTIYPAGKERGEPLHDGALIQGETTVDLPEDHPRVATWKALGWLTPAGETKAEAPAPEASAMTKQEAAPTSADAPAAPEPAAQSARRGRSGAVNEGA